MRERELRAPLKHLAQFGRRLVVAAGAIQLEADVGCDGHRQRIELTGALDLGHASITTTQRYLNVTDNEMLNAMQNKRWQSKDGRRASGRVRDARLTPPLRRSST